MNNDFGWKKMPFLFFNENSTFMIDIALLKNFSTYFVGLTSNTFESISAKTRIKKFVFRCISVVVIKIYQGRSWLLKRYTKESCEVLLFLKKTLSFVKKTAKLNFLQLF
ncbi:hypothetical protein [Polaribacter glomeratus]|uniref:Transposase DDE domain-containing protein n=1 Tax=Polaribacter glomeratus TaxID=102 RepID=A0A2S7WG96_9FLAO|nr:hypothetical protein [Polaribacter glomeratus]PQJ76649.1 hypothetical protein BTO16_12235 [Polaribacter glomeratus]TXD67512.1 hypothetical protein ESX12_02680 [Polaribacter glomeratus]